MPYEIERQPIYTIRGGWGNWIVGTISGGQNTCISGGQNTSISGVESGVYNSISGGQNNFGFNSYNSISG